MAPGEQPITTSDMQGGQTPHLERPQPPPPPPYSSVLVTTGYPQPSVFYGVSGDGGWVRRDGGVGIKHLCAGGE